MEVKEGDYVKCIKTPQDPSLIREGEIYKVTWAAPTGYPPDSICIIDRTGTDGKDIDRSFNFDNWFKKARMTNALRTKLRMEKLNG